MQDQNKQEKLNALVASAVSQEMTRPLSLLSINRAYLWSRLGCDNPGADERVKQALDGIGLASSHIERLWRNCTDLFDCAQGQLIPRKEPVDLCEVLDQIEEEQEYIQRATGVQLEIHHPEEEVCVKTDSAMVEKVLLNLLSNALRLTESGGKVIVNLTENHSGVQLSVQDFCGGMAEEQVSVLCGTQDNAVEPKRGIGIGLHLCREFCRLLDWEPVVRTNSKGSTITLRVPITEILPAGQLVFRSNTASEEQRRDTRQARIRLELGSVPGLEAYWTA